jgi:hypothetical protein
LVVIVMVMVMVMVVAVVVAKDGQQKSSMGDLVPKRLKRGRLRRTQSSRAA